MVLNCCFVGVCSLFDDKVILVSIDTESITREIIYAYIALTNKSVLACDITDSNCVLSPSKRKTKNRKLSQSN